MCLQLFFYNNFFLKGEGGLKLGLYVFHHNNFNLINIYSAKTKTAWLSVNSLQIEHRNCVETFVSSVQSSVAFRVFIILLFLRKFKVMDLVTYIVVQFIFSLMFFFANFFSQCCVCKFFYALLGLCEFFLTNSSTPPPTRSTGPSLT